MIRIAAVGDVHVDKDVVGRYRPALEELPGRADALLVAGDLTRHGTVEEARCFAKEFGDLHVPVVVVLGNHDHQSDQEQAVTEVLTDAGITVLECSATVLEIRGHRLGVAGATIWWGVRSGRKELVNGGMIFLTVLLLVKVADAWWDSLPRWAFFLVIAGIAIGILVLLRWVRGRLTRRVP